MLILYRSIVALLLALVVLLAAGSLYAFVRPQNSGPLFRVGGTGGRIQSTGREQNLSDGTVTIFSGIGRLRIPATGRAFESEPMTVILTINFPYPAADRPFAEELASRIGEFRSIATGYFSSLSREQLLRIDENAAKTEILRGYNELLRLGKIETLYFSDLMVIE